MAQLTDAEAMLWGSCTSDLAIDPWNRGSSWQT